MNEYRLLTQPLTSLEKTTRLLNDYAAEGWQVVSITPARRSLRADELLITLRRGPQSHLVSGQQIISLDYPVDPASRYGHGRPAHEGLYNIINAGRDRYRETFAAVLEHRDHLSAIPVEAKDPLDPSWVNNWMPGFDTAALYHFVAKYQPSLYFEVGSGVSTRFVRRAINDYGLKTKIRSIDPHPRVECDVLCDEVVRTRMEDADLALFEELSPGDILFIDSSHRMLPNSDVTVLFLDILPRLPAGVILQMHDIWIPYDYPPEWSERFYSEQYVLAAHLLAGGPGEILLANCFASFDSELSRALDPLFSQPGFESVERHGESFWMITG